MFATAHYEAEHYFLTVMIIIIPFPSFILPKMQHYDNHNKSQFHKT